LHGQNEGTSGIWDCHITHCQLTVLQMTAGVIAMAERLSKADGMTKFVPYSKDRIFLQIQLELKEWIVLWIFDYIYEDHGHVNIDQQDINLLCDDKISESEK